TKFMSLSGWAGIMAGIYALVGVWIAHTYLGFNPRQIVFGTLEPGVLPSNLPQVIYLALLILFLAVGTAVLLSYRKAYKREEKVWNATSRRLLINIAIPLLAGGVFILLLYSKGLIGLMAPSTLLFYGLALYNAGNFTYREIKYLGLIQIGLGLISIWFISYSLLLWAFGFGVVHIAYGIYMHLRYER
ncbi:MAG: hypothetical protein ACNS64_00630, partial [Candidatus Halalkalibacterium sp. M3_1C_030]